MVDIFDQLVRQTLEGAGEFTGLDPFDVGVPAPLVPSSCGILYKLELSQSTFCIRAISVKNLAESWKLLEAGDEAILKKLRPESHQTCHFFVTQFPELGEILCDQLSNRRYPSKIEDIHHLNLYDLYWVYERTDTGLKIYMNAKNLSLRDGDGDFSKRVILGPLGDNPEAHERFSTGLQRLASFLPVEDLRCEERFIELKLTDTQHPKFILLTELLEQGDLNPIFLEALYENQDPSHYYFWHEMATMRKFWNELQHTLARLST